VSGKAASITSARGIARNGVYVAVSQLLLVPITLAVTALMLRRLGLRTFGGWALMDVLLGYAGLVEFGIRVPLVKYVSQFNALGDHAMMSRCASTALAYYTAFGALVTLGLIAASPWVTSRFLRISMSHNALIAAYTLAVLTFFLNLVAGVFSGVLVGVQRFDVDSELLMLRRAMDAVGTIAVLLLGAGLLGIATVELIDMVIALALNAALARRLVPVVVYRRSLVSPAMFKQMFSFSARVQLARVSLQLNEQYAKLAFGWLLGIGSVGLLQLAEGVCSRAPLIPQALASTVTPAASDLGALDLHLRTRKLLLRSLRYTTLFSMPLIAGSICFAHPFVRLWVGAGYGPAANAIMALSLGYGLWILSMPAANVLAGLGRPGYEMYAAIVRLVLNLVLTTLLTVRFGFYGGVAGLALALAGSSALLIGICHRALALPLRRSLGECVLSPGIGAALAGTLGWMGAALLDPYGWAGLLAASALFGFAYLGYVVLFVAEDDDVAIVRQLMPARLAPVGRRLR
jgi:O-antigen/teichoic acid export membrane protein